MSEKKLFRVAVMVDVYVMAADALDAEEWVTDNVSEWQDDLQSGTTSARAVTDLKEVPSEWRNSIPWNGDTDATVEAILKEPV